MKHTSVRIWEIELKGFKNVVHGKISLFGKPPFKGAVPGSGKSGILGIYGQNGSGKTAVVEALELVQTLLSGASLPEDSASYIGKEEKECQIRTTFLIETETSYNISLAEYQVKLRLLPEQEFEISEEALLTANWNGSKFERKKRLFRRRTESKTSFLFGSENKNSPPDCPFLTKILCEYAQTSLFVISNAYSGAISMDWVIPLSYCLEIDNKITKGVLSLGLEKPSLLDKGQLKLLEQIVEGINCVLSVLIPGLFLGIRQAGAPAQEKGKYSIELVSKRGKTTKTTIPLKDESEGILKIISILNALICVYNNPGACLILDELDSGIYEYLLGELLSAFEKGAKGQLIFTSHNLRPLEMLSRENILFSTTNPSNRYIHLKKGKKGNLREAYLRSITLGGQKEEVYAETDRVEIGRAFRCGGKAGTNGFKDQESHPFYCGRADR